MAIIYNINETIHLRDEWESPVTGEILTINDTIHLRDSLNRVVAPAGPGDTLEINETIHLRDITTHGNSASGPYLYINDEIHLRDTDSFFVFAPDSLIINETIHLRDSYERTVEIGGIYQFINDVIHLHDLLSFTVEATYTYIRNENISFGETKEVGYKEYSHRFRWTNYNGIAVPDLNYKDLKEPIVRIMPAPSFLQFEYANSFLLFTRNSINRFILKADVDTGQWRAETDNLIEEFKDLGLMEPKSLVLAGDTLFGLSEKGVWKWNKNGMELISDKIIDLPDAGVYEYIAFYSSIRNQYILHRQEGSGNYLQLNHGTPVEAPDHLGTTSLSDVKTVMLTDTKFVVISFISSSSLRLIVGDIDLIAKSVAYGSSNSLFGNQIAKTSLIAMGNGTSVVFTSDSAGTPRKINAATISGNTSSIGSSPVDVADGNYDGGVLIKFTETTFACITTDTGAYQTGSVAGNVVTLNGVQYSGISFRGMKSVYIGNGISVIAYHIWGANIFVRTVEDNGDGTINLGTALDTTVQTSTNSKLDIKAVSPTFILLVASTANDLQTVPLTLDGTTLTKGTVNTETGYFDSSNMDLAIANKGESGMWLFFEDARNSNYLTAMWGSISETEIVMAETIVEVVQDYKTQSVAADAVVGGFALLHYNEGTIVSDDGYTSVWGLGYVAINSFVYQIDKDKWAKFLGMDILDVPVILSGGSLDENYNLWLDSDRELKKYPGTAYTAVEAVIRTKEFYIEKGAFQRWMVDFEGSSVNVETRVKKTVSGSIVNEEDIKYNIVPNKFRGISLDKQRGYEMSIKIIDANIISGLSFDSKKWGEK